MTKSSRNQILSVWLLVLLDEQRLNCEKNGQEKMVVLNLAVQSHYKRKFCFMSLITRSLIGHSGMIKAEISLCLQMIGKKLKNKFFVLMSITVIYLDKRLS